MNVLNQASVGLSKSAKRRQRAKTARTRTAQDSAALVGKEEEPSATTRAPAEVGRAFRAFVVETEGDNGYSFGRSTSVWVFSNGLGVGESVVYHKRSICSRPPVRDQELAHGVVASIAGAEVSFAWERALELEEDPDDPDAGDSEWRISSRLPKATLKMTPESWEKTRYDYGYDRDKFDAKEVDTYKIDVPDAVWALLKPINVIFTLVSAEPCDDGHLRLAFTALSGAQFHLDVEESLTVTELAKQILEMRGLTGGVAKILTKDGSLLPGQSMVSTLATDS